MIFNRTEKEEKAYLMDIIALLAANIEQMDKAIEDKALTYNRTPKIKSIVDYN